MHLDKKLLNFVSATYSVIGGSPTLFAALEDPNIEVPGIDANIPKMNKLGGDSRHVTANHLLNEENKRDIKKLH